MNSNTLIAGKFVAQVCDGTNGCSPPFRVHHILINADSKKETVVDYTIGFGKREA